MKNVDASLRKGRGQSSLDSLGKLATASQKFMKFTEAQLESAIIELLGVEGYPHVLGRTIERQPQEVLIKADLRTFLARQYASDQLVIFLSILETYRGCRL